MSARMVRYKGVNRAGSGIVGATCVDDLAAWTEHRYRQGVRWLLVWVGANEANPVAEIVPHPDTGHRIWWAEAADERDPHQLSSRAGGDSAKNPPPARVSQSTPSESRGLTPMDFSDAIDRHFPYDGPHCRDRVIDAAHGISALVRYLNNATGPGNGRTTLAWGATVYRVLGGVGGAVGGLDQLITQLAEAADRLAGDPTLYDDRRDRPGRQTALELAAVLDQRVRPALAQVLGALDEARELGVHLGND